MILGFILCQLSTKYSEIQIAYIISYLSTICLYVDHQQSNAVALDGQIQFCNRLLSNR